LSPAFQKTLRFSSVVGNTVNRTGIHRLDVAGKGINVSRVLSQLGKNVVHLTPLGGVMRPLFLSLCEEDSLSVEWVESNGPIRSCYTIINDADSSVTELVEESPPVGAGTEEALLEKFLSLLSGRKFLVISGTRAAGFSDALIPFMVQKAKEAGLTVIVDIKGKDLVESLRHRPDFIKPNLYEFAATFAPDLIQDNDLLGDEAGVKERIKSESLNLCERFGCRIILTRGSRKIWAARERDFFEVDVGPVKPVNTIGSGDAFTAGLAAALGDGADFTAAITRGIRCGGLNAALFRPGVIR
jgi:1-phosphofructokinase/tagatose 6-phosphate kinase